MRGDMFLAIGILCGIIGLATASVWVFDHSFSGTVAVIRLHAHDYAIGPEDAPLVGLTLGLIVACTYTVWPVFLVAHLWRVAHRALPWRLLTFAIELQQSQIIIRDGDTFKFRYAGLRTYLGETLYHELRADKHDHGGGAPVRAGDVPADGPIPSPVSRT